MRERQEHSHQVQMKDRKALELTGILGVECFDSDQFIVDTPLGFLHIRGRELHIKSLNLTEKKLSIEGRVDDLTYRTSVNIGRRKRKQSIVGRILK